MNDFEKRAFLEKRQHEVDLLVIATSARTKAGKAARKESTHLASQLAALYYVLGYGREVAA